MDNNKKLNQLLRNVTALKHDHIIIAGDFNTKQINWELNSVRGKESTYQYKLFDTVNDLFLKDVVQEPTRFRGSDNPSNLDWVLTENIDCILDKSLDAPLGPSDHSLIKIKYECTIESDMNDDTPHYSYYNGDYDTMRTEFSDAAWTESLDTMDTQQAWDSFHNRLLGLIEKHVPKKKYTNAKRPPWYGREIGLLSKQKKKAWNKYRKSSTSENWSNYTHHRNKLAHSIERCKEEYENRIALESKENPKRFWKYIKSQTKSKGKITELADKDGNLTTDDLQKAEILNNHFASVFTKEDINNIPDFSNRSENIIDTIEITEENLTKELSTLPIGKSAGPDGISNRILRELANQIAPILKNVYDKSINESKLPYQWKEAHVVAIYKKGRKKSANNYRPVSLTAICCKLLEKIIRNKMVKHLEDQGLINKDQHGFRYGRSCCTELLEVMETWTRWFDLGLPWDAIYTDFSKAFDSVPHERLLLKVEAYGIKGDLLKWIRDFLTDRKQRVVIGDKMSSWKPVTSGIPQGSVLGPILFTIFINDMPEAVDSLMKLFADDANIFKAIESIGDVTLIQDDLNKLLGWSNIWQLPLNISKCKAMHYGKGNPEHSYQMGDTPLATDTTETDVGVTTDTELNFRLHMKW